MLKQPTIPPQTMLVVLVPLDFILKVLLIIDFDVEVDAGPSHSIS